MARSEDGGNNWTRERIAGHTPMGDHEVSLAVDTADNIYAVWQGSFRLPYLSVSRDHGQTWSTPIMIAPPGVHEVNFPTIVAGDAGRIALLFPGSESQDFTDRTRPWNIYVVVSVNALDANPILTWTVANDKRTPSTAVTAAPAGVTRSATAAAACSTSWTSRFPRPTGPSGARPPTRVSARA